MKALVLRERERDRERQRCAGPKPPKVKAKLMEVNANSFNEMLDAKMDEVAGAGKYVQERLFCGLRS